MGTISKDVVLTALSEFDYFRAPAAQSSVVDEYDEMVECDKSQVNSSTLTFEVKGEPMLYRDLSNTFLEITCKVVKKDGSSIAATDAVAPVNNFLHSLFEECDITINGTTITETQKHYHYRAFIETLLSSDPTVLRTRSCMDGWHLDDDADKLDSILLTGEGAKAFRTRNALIQESCELKLIGRLHADIFHQDLDLPENCRMVVKLTRASNQFVLMGAKAQEYKVVITHACLHVKTKKVSLDVVEAHRQLSLERNLRIPYTKVLIDEYHIPAGHTSHNVNDLFRGKLPRRMIIGLVSQTRVNGDYELNPFKFEHCNLKSIKCTLGGTSIPRDSLKMDYPKKQFSRAYMHTLTALNLDIVNRGIELGPNLWAAAYNLYAFKLQPGPIQHDLDGPISHAGVDLKLEFDSALSNVMTILVYSETNSALEVDSYGHVSVA